MSISGLRCPQQDISDRVRGRTMVMLDEALDAEEIYRKVHSQTFTRRARRHHDRTLRDAFALDSPEFAAYETAIAAVRAWCAADRNAAISELEALSIEQVEQDLRLTAALRVVRRHEEREGARAIHREAVAWLHCGRDVLCQGLGWPHIAEPVVIQATYWRAAGPKLPAEERVHEGLALYGHSFSTMNTSHAVFIPGELDPVLVSWAPLREAHGPALSSGDIPLRRAADPDAALISPPPRWPTAVDVSEYDETAAVAAGEQMAFAA